MDHPPDCPLSPPELAVVQLLADGLTYTQIAQKRGRSVSTVRTQLHSVYTKLGVFDRAQAVLAVQGHGWISGGKLIPETREVVMLQRIDRLLNEAIEAIRDRNTKAGITQVQREYLRAFDSYLRSTPLVEDDAREELNERLDFVLAEAGVIRSATRRHRMETDGQKLRHVPKSPPIVHRRVSPNRARAATRQGMAERIGLIYTTVKRLQPVRVAAIATELGMETYTVNNTLAKMLASGVVTKVADDVGRGVRWCVLTADVEDIAA